jgi:hypothetical protein
MAPTRGVRVCRLTADGGPVRNKADLQGLCKIITERLKRLLTLLISDTTLANRR